jgi:UPF0042 nucleotide-binding protein
VVDGIRREQELLAPVLERSDLIIDTTGLSLAGLRRKVADELLEPEAPGRLAVTFTSFGHMHGPARDADLAFDVRFLPNPHYVPELRDHTGLDDDVREYVENSAGIDEFYARLVPLLDYLLPAYADEGKQHLTIGIGCTGGKHRSVVIAEHLAGIYRGTESFSVEVTHRDIDKRPRP